MEQQDQIRQRINDRLADLGMSVRGASTDAGLGETTLRNFLKGMTLSLTVDSVAKLAPVLKTSQEWLLFGSREGASDEIVDLLGRISADRRPLAMDVLRSFADHGK